MKAIYRHKKSGDLFAIEMDAGGRVVSTVASPACYGVLAWPLPKARELNLSVLAAYRKRLCNSDQPEAFVLNRKCPE
jgi:hypothetical protein